MTPGRESPTRYEILFKLASGGMATVYVGTARGSMGFRQVVAIKEPHPHLLDDKEYRRELLAEARLASLIHHANVVDVRDVEASSRTIRLIMDYIEGASFGELIVLASKAGRRLPPGVVVRVALDACAGLHAAHELVDEKGRKVGLVHRDVSPQNILVGLDGTTRVSDFGVAKATAASVTASGTLKGKIAYMAPEYVEGKPIDRRVDVFGLGVVVWEALAGKRLFRAKSEPETVQRVLLYEAPPISREVPELGTHLDAALATALAKTPQERFATAQALGAALEVSAKAAGLIASHSEVAAFVAELAGELLEGRRMQVRARLSQEPGLLSLMGAPPPSLPQSAPAPSTARELATVPEIPAIRPEAPSTKSEVPAIKPEQDVAPTLIDTPPLDLPPPTPLLRSTEPIVTELSSGSGITPAGVPSGRGGAALLVGGALLLGALAVGAGVVVLRGGRSAASTSANASATGTSAAATSAAATSASATTSASAKASSGDEIAPLAPLAPVSAAVHAGHPPHAAATKTHNAAPTTPDGPPPNPY
jgi:serine/threonine protein kinase